MDVEPASDDLKQIKETLRGRQSGIATNVTIVSMRQRLIPNDLLGRVNATYQLVGMGTMPIGALLGGLAAEQLVSPPSR